MIFLLIFIIRKSGNSLIGSLILTSGLFKGCVIINTKIVIYIILSGNVKFWLYLCLNLLIV